MSGHAKFVNVVPHVKIKKEVIEEDEDCVECRICNKSFASDIALRNHARMEHIDAFASGDPEIWTAPKRQRKVSETEPIVNERVKVEVDPVKVKAENLLSSMSRANLMSLASKDVSYIIIKSDSPVIEKKRKRDRGNGDKDKKRKVEKSETEKPVKETPAITGPFECLQPSNLVEEGTCHQIFFSCCEYSLHFRDEHTRRRKGLRCQVCEKPLGNAHEPQAPYPCEVCGMGFQTNKELSDHMASDHVKLKPFECGVCHKRFTQQGGVQQHMRMHTGDRPFNCTFCPKAFTQKSGLDQHLRIHTKVKPYRCVICSKTFCQSIHLKQHMRTHTNVSPFQCGICSKRFKQSSHLNYHLKNHNPAVMSDEQRQEYNKLIELINKNEPKKVTRKVYCVTENGLKMVEVEMGDQVENEVQVEGEVVESMESVEGVEESVVLDDQSEQQLMLAEQSIQENQLDHDDETYILSDTGNEVWSVKLVEEETS